MNPPDCVLVGAIANSHNSGGTNLLVAEFDHWCVEPVAFENVPCVQGPGIYGQGFDTDTPAPIDAVYPDIEPVDNGVYSPEVVGGRLRLTSDAVGGNATAVYFDPSVVGAGLGNQAWLAHFSFFYHGNPNPADGINFFVLETDNWPTGGLYLGGSGGSEGYEQYGNNDIPGQRTKSFAVEFDNWDGGYVDNDPPGGHGSNAGAADLYHMGINFHQTNQSAQNNVEYGATPLPSIWNSDNGILVEVTYRPRMDLAFPSPEATSEIVVRVVECGLDNDPLPGVAWTEILRAIGPKLNDDIVFGFSGATGGATANQEIGEFTVWECEGVILGELFVRGDVTVNSQVDLTDGIYLFNYLFLGGPNPPCDDAADCNDDGGIDLSDGIFALNWLFLGGPKPPPPSPSGGTYNPATDCGIDPTSDILDCLSFPPCGTGGP